MDMSRILSRAPSEQNRIETRKSHFCVSIQERGFCLISNNACLDQDLIGRTRLQLVYPSP